MSMAMELPDVSEEEWRKYQARLFAEQAANTTQAMTFRAHVADPLMAQMMGEMSQAPLQAPAPLPPIVAPPPPPQPAMPVPSFPATQAPLGMPDRQNTPSPGDPTSLISQLNAAEQPPGQSAGPAPSGGSWFDGANPTTRSFFGQAQDTYAKAAQDARESGFSQAPIIGGALTGLAQGASDVMGGLSGSAEDLRQGNVLGALGGTLQATLNAPSDVVRGMTTEMQVPDRIIPGIDPSTFALGGLNSPREWAPIASQFLIPETAAEGLMGKGISAAFRGAKGPEAAAKFLEMAGKGVDAMGGVPTVVNRGLSAVQQVGQGLESIGRRMPEVQSAVVTGPGPTRTPGGITAGGDVGGNVVNQALSGGVGPGGFLAKTGAQAATDIGLGAAGGIYGAATAPDDATWQERGIRGLEGAAAGALLGPAARGLTRNARSLAGALSDETLGAKAGGGFNPERLGQRAPRRLGPVNPEDLGPGEITRPGQRLPERERIADLAQEAPEMEAVSHLYDETPEIEPPPPTTSAVDRLRAEAVAEQAQQQAEELARMAREREAQGLPPEKGPDLSKSLGRVAAEDVVGGPKPAGYPAEQMAMGMEDAGGRATQLNPLPKAYAQEGAPKLPEAPSGPGAADVTMIGKAAAVAQPDKPPLGTDFARRLAEQTAHTDQGAAEADLLDPGALVPEQLTKRQQERLGHPQTYENLPQDAQEMASEMRANLVAEYTYMHGGQTDAEAKAAADRLMPYILDVAANATPNMAVNQAMLTAMRQAAADLALPTAIARDRMMMALDRDPQKLNAVTQQLIDDFNAKNEVHQVFQLANEAMSSESGRTFSSHRTLPTPAGIAEGGASSITSQAASDQEMNDLIRLRAETPGSLQAKQYVKDLIKKRDADIKAGKRTSKALTPEEWTQVARAQRSMHWTYSDRRMGGPMEQQGLLWEDIFNRSPEDKDLAEFTQAERLKAMFGLEDLGGKIHVDKFYGDFLKLDPRDSSAVRDFWIKAWGASTNRSEAVAASVLKMAQSRAKGAPEGKLVKRWERVKTTMMDFDQGVADLDREIVAPRPDQDAIAALDAKVQDIKNQMTTLRANTNEDLAALGIAYPKDLHIQLEKQLADAEEAARAAKAGPGILDTGEPTWRPSVQEVLPFNSSSEHWNPTTGKVERTKSALEVARTTLEARLDFYTKRLETATADRNQFDVKKYGDLVKRSKYDLNNSKGLLSTFKNKYPKELPYGQLDTPERLATKKDLMSSLDWRGTDNPNVLWMRRGVSVLTSNMLSTLRMLENSVGEAAAVMLQTPYGYFFDKGDTEAAKEFLRGSLGQDFGPALANAAKTFTTGSGPVHATGYLKNISERGADLIRSDALQGNAAWLAPMHRGSSAISEFFQTLAYQGEMRVQALKAARESALPRRGDMALDAITGDYDPTSRMAFKGQNRSMQSFLEAPTKEMNNAAIVKAQEIASGGPHTLLAHTLGNLKSQLDLGTTPSQRAIGALANIVFPFVYGVDPAVRFGVSVIKAPFTGATKTAMALARGDMNMAARQGTATALSAATLAWLGSLVGQGMATGSGPQDPNKREALMEATDSQGDPVWRPDSLRIPVIGPNGVRHVWMAYTSMPIISLPLSMMANAWEAYQFDGVQPQGKDPQKMDNFGAIVHAGQMMGQAFLQGSFLNGIVQLADLFNGSNQASMGRFAGGILGRAVPLGGLARQVAYASDPYEKVAQSNDAGGFAGVPQQIAEGVPGLRNLVPNRVSPYTGQAVPTNDSWASLLTPGRTYAGGSPQNPAANAALATGQFQPGFTRMQQSEGADFLGTHQTGSAIRGAAQQFGQATGSLATDLINSPEYQAMTPQQKAAALDRTFSEAKNQGQYGAEEQVSLGPNAMAEHLSSGIPRYVGVSGTPAEIAAMNQKIGSARAILARLSAQYGPQMAKVYLQQLSPEQFQLAVSYRPVAADALYQQEQMAMSTAGATNDFTSQPLGGLDLSSLPLPPSLTPSQRARM